MEMAKHAYTLKVCEFHAVYTLKVCKQINNHYFCTIDNSWYDTTKSFRKFTGMEQK